MQASNALALKSIRRFKQASKSNMAEWFREFLRNRPAKKLTAQNYLAPLKAFMKYIKNMLRTMRPAEASGVAKGKWKLPCGLMAAKAWTFLEKQFALLRLNMVPEVKDVALKPSSRKGNFLIVPTEPKAPTELAHRRRKPSSAMSLELVNGQWLRVISPESFKRRPQLDGPIVKGEVNRRDKRGPAKPRARCI